MIHSVAFHSTKRRTAGLRGATAVGAVAMTLLAAAPAQAAFVSACSGVALQRSQLTSILSPVVNGIVTPTQNTVNGLLGAVGGIPVGLGVLPAPLSIDPAGILANAATGGNINLAALKTDGTLFGPADTCDSTSDSVTTGSVALATPAGLSLGGNKITGLGNGAVATAGEINSIAIGNGAATDATSLNAVAHGTNAAVRANSSGAIALGNTAAVGPGAPGAVAIGQRATATTASGVALGEDSTDQAAVGTSGATIGGTAYTFAGRNPDGVVSVGSGGEITRQIVNVSAGQLNAGSTDAVNGSQLFATNTAVGVNTTAITNLNTGTAGTVQRTAAPNGLTLVAPGGTGTGLPGPGAAQTLSNVATGIAATDAVNVGQLNGSIGAAAAAAPVQYSTVAGVPTPGVASNDATLVGAAVGPVALHNVAAGVAPTDAVNAGQLAATNAAVASNTTSIAGNTTAITTLSVGVTTGTVGLVQQTGGAPGNGPITVGAATGGTVVDFTGTGGVRTLSGVAAGVAPTDAVNVSQLTTSVGAATANAVQYDNAGKTSVTLGGVGAAAPTTVTNVAAGALTPTSTDAVNGSQLAATNAQVGTNTTNIAGNTTAITSLNNGTAGPVQQTGAPNGLALVAPGATGAAPGAAQTLSNVAAGVAPTDAVNLGQVGTLIGTSAAASPIQYANAAAPTTPTPGVVSNDTTLVGTAAGTPVGLHNVAAGTVTAGSTDAVNGGQLAATNAQVGTNTTNIAGNTTAITNLTNGVNNGTMGLVQQTGGAPGTGQITVGAATGGTSVSVAGTDGNRTLTGLSAGVAGNDAVTVAQLNGLTGGGLNTVQYDPTATGGRSNTVTLAGGAAGPVAINNVAPAPLAAGSTGAVNGGQLYATNQQVAGLTNGTAGAFQSNNAAAAPPPVASGANATAGGFGASATGAGGVALGNGATSTGTGSVALGQGSTDGGAARVVSVGGVGSERRITNVAPALNATDAVNLSQLQTATNAFTTTTNGLQNQINQTNFDLNNVRRRANGGTAGAMAAAGLPQAFEPGRSMVGGGIGYWADQVAFAIGVSTIVGERTVLKASGSISGQGVGGFNAGVGYQF